MGHLPRLGLIGLGIMGRPMGRNLLRAGYALVVRDLNPEAVTELVAEGAVAAPTSRFKSSCPTSDWGESARYQPSSRQSARGPNTERLRSLLGIPSSRHCRGVAKIAGHLL
jgi:hypothetical protein